MPLSFVMASISDFVSRCDAWAQTRGFSRAHASTIILNDGKRLDALANGAGITVSRLERAYARLKKLESGKAEAKRQPKLAPEDEVAA